MGEVIKIGMLGIVGVLLAVQFKSMKTEYSVYIGMGLAILVFGYVLRQVEAVMSQISFVKNYLGMHKAICPFC